MQHIFFTSCPYGFILLFVLDKDLDANNSLNYENWYIFNTKPIKNRLSDIIYEHHIWMNSYVITRYP